MKRRIWLIALCAALLTAAVGATAALAANADEEFKAGLEKARERAEQSAEKWEGLTDGQRAELDALTEQANGIQRQIIDKLLEWGVIDEETAGLWKDAHEYGFGMTPFGGRFSVQGDFNGRFHCFRFEGRGEDGNGHFEWSIPDWAEPGGNPVQNQGANTKHT